MSDEQTTEQAAEETEDVEAATEETAEETAAEDGDDKPLGPKGEKALQAEKERRRALAAELRELRAELAKLRDGDGDEATRAAREAEKAALAKANAKILRSEVKAAAAGKLADPTDALRLLDLDSFEVGEDGEIDEDEIADAINNLLKNKPYLAAQSAKRFQGTGDGGSRKGGGRPKQLTRDDLKGMSPEAIVAAREQGRLSDLLGAER
jgi:hypothetical protein